MGCCLSHPAGPNAPYPGGAASASERAINAPSVGDRSSFVSGPASVSAPAGGRASIAAPASAASPSAETGNSNSDSDATIASASSVSAAVRSQPRRQQPAVLATTPTATALSAPGGAPASHPSSSSSHQPLHQLAQHINKPLGRPRRWTARNRMWSRQSIDRERVDFFDTRVTGRIEIWQTLRAVLELQWEADRAAAAATDTTTDESAEEEARATAQTILDAAAITLPTGDLTQGAYDVFGNFYALPAWIVSDPTNLLEREPGEAGEDDDDDSNASGGSRDGAAEDQQDQDGDDEGEDSDPKTALGRRRSYHGDVAAVDDSDTLSSSSGDRSSDDDDDDDGGGGGDEGRTSRRREEKGKAVLPAADAAAAAAAPSRHRRRPVMVTLRARLSLTGRDVVLRVGRDASVRSVAHQIAERAKLPSTHRVRVAYMGRILKEGHSLPAQGWQEGHVVSALVFEGPPPSRDG